MEAVHSGPDRIPEGQLAEDEVSAQVKNPEISSIAIRYLKDERKSDIRELLLDPSFRPIVIKDLKSIADRADRSLLDFLVDRPIDINSIRGAEAGVDALGEEMIKRDSRLMAEHVYKTPDDKDYMTAEIGFHKKRRESDPRWLAFDPQDPKDRKSAGEILSEAGEQLPVLEEFIGSVKAKLPDKESIATTSGRVKDIDSLFKKTSKFRDTSWGKEATIANAVDLLGARIVVTDLNSLEKVMESVEATLRERPEFVVLRKENKFIANHKTPDPYRAIHYIVAIPGTLHSFELQLTTFSSLIAGELAHDAVYKPHLLNLPGELQQTVREYNWENAEHELRAYLELHNETPVELSREQKVEKSIRELDYNTFYDLVLSQIDLKKPIDDSTKDLLVRFHKNEVEKLRILQESDEATIIDLARAAHDGYFLKNSKDFLNLGSDQLPSFIPQEAVDILDRDAQSVYLNRYENFDGKNNKLSIEDLKLHKLSDKDLEDFFTAAYKDVTLEGTKLRALIDKIKSLRDDTPDSLKKRKSIYILNINSAPFDTLMDLTNPESVDVIKNPEARKTFRETLISTQIKAVATASLLTEIGGKDEHGRLRDLSQEALPGTGYSVREMLTHMFFITAYRPTSEVAKLSFEEFATSPKTAWARDNDKTVDQAVLTKLVGKQLESIAETLGKEINPVLVARYEKARYELLIKYARAVMDDQTRIDEVTDFIESRSRNEVHEILRLDEKTKIVVKRIGDATRFAAFTNFLNTAYNVKIP